MLYFSSSLSNKIPPLILCTFHCIIDMHTIYAKGRNTLEKDKTEKEREYYNRKILKESFSDEMKKPRRMDWAELIAVFIGVFLGLTIRDVIGTEQLISNSAARFFADTVITVIMILAVQGIFALAKKLTAKKQN